MKLGQTILLFFITITAYSQEFKWEVPLDTPSVSGYYDIQPSKEIVGLLNHIYTDIRIYDKNGMEVPYLRLNNKAPKQAFTAQKIVVKDSASRTHYRIEFEQACHLSEFLFNIEQPKQFLRKAALKRISEVSKEVYADTIILSSKKTNRFPVFNYSKLTTCELVVENFDDQALAINSVVGYQKGVTLTAKLAGGQPYTLKLGSPSLKAPIYDIQYFEEELPLERPILGVATSQLKKINPKVVTDQIATNPPKKETFLDNNWLWIALGFVLLLLGYMTVKMIREMK